MQAVISAATDIEALHVCKVPPTVSNVMRELHQVGHKQRGRGLPVAEHAPPVAATTGYGADGTPAELAGAAAWVTGAPSGAPVGAPAGANSGAAAGPGVGPCKAATNSAGRQ